MKDVPRQKMTIKMEKIRIVKNTWIFCPLHLECEREERRLQTQNDKKSRKIIVKMKLAKVPIILTPKIKKFRKTGKNEKKFEGNLKKIIKNLKKKKFFVISRV